MAELDILRSLGWRNEVFVVPGNFIGNSNNVLQLTREIRNENPERPPFFVLHRSIGRPSGLSRTPGCDTTCAFLAFRVFVPRGLLEVCRA
jgi:hypothetical protein